MRNLLVYPVDRAEVLEYLQKRKADLPKPAPGDMDHMMYEYAIECVRHHELEVDRLGMPVGPLGTLARRRVALDELARTDGEDL
jgi:hypothetical protein